MSNVLVKAIAVAVMVSGVAIGTAYAQEHDHLGPAAASAARPAPTAKPAAAVHPPDEFCETVKTGQLCSTGTTTLLGLTPEKREVWVVAVRPYNRAVNAAIMALQGEARNALSPAQVAEVNRWLALGINPQINQILQASAGPAGAK